MTAQLWEILATGIASILVQVWAASRTNAFFQGKVEQRFKQAEENIERIDESKNKLWERVWDHESSLNFIQGQNANKPNGELH